MIENADNAARLAAAGGETSIAAVSTLIKLRWWMIGSELFAVIFTARVVEQDLHVLPLAVLVGLQLATNLVTLSFQRRGRSGSAERALVTALLAFDIACLTSVIHFSGGPTNPFSSLFVIHTLVAVMVLTPGRSAAFAAMSCLGYGAVLILATGGEFTREALDRIGHGMHRAVGGHLVGMWVSLSLTIVVVTIFGGQLLRKLRQNEESLSRARAEMMESARVASLTAFAAGAAHELSTPLSTIVVVAGELSRQMADRPKDDAWVRDLTLIRSEVGRCQRIIQSLRFDPGGAAVKTDAPFGSTLREELTVLLGEPLMERVRFHDTIRTPTAGLPARGIAHAVAALVRNAIEASSPDQRVDLELREGASRISILVKDEGRGIPKDILPNVMEPFITSKPVGQALGLGLFLARVTCDQLQAKLRLESEPGRGTTASIELPQFDPPR